MSEPDRAIAVEQTLRRLQADYVHCIDADRLEDLPDFFRADAAYRVVTSYNESRGLPIAIIEARNRDMLHDRITALRGANVYEPQRYRHILSFMRITDCDDDLIQAETNFMVIRTTQDGDQDFFVSGLYRDHIDLTGNKPLFAAKTVVLDSDKIDTLLAIPL